MTPNIDPSWLIHFQNEFSKPYFKELMHFIDNAYQNHTCYPSYDKIFQAFNACKFQDVKVVIIGQDPYHGPNQANGLCFSVQDGVTHPPSLKNIFKELETDTGKPYPVSGNLEHWAEQGVLLLNATLTVHAHEAGSHKKKGWEIFTDSVIKTISNQHNDVVFMLWGGFAKSKAKLIAKEKHTILLSGHPSPLSANRGYWFGNKHFSQANAFLKANNKSPINW
ncbi:uracil-DNA glycosylase [Bizionia sp. KMM 8389]